MEKEYLDRIFEIFIQSKINVLKIDFLINIIDLKVLVNYKSFYYPVNPVKKNHFAEPFFFR